jgi:hypothetical protein
VSVALYGRGRNTNWRNVLRSVCETYHIKPWELAELTLAELCWLCEDEKQTNMSDDDVKAYGNRIVGMSYLERIRAIRRGEL